MMMVNLNIVETYTVGKESFIVALCKALGIPQLIDNSLNSSTDRPPKIPYEVLSMMMVNMCNDHHPLYLLNEYYKYKDIEGIFHYPISLGQINNSRFDSFLNQSYVA